MADADRILEQIEEAIVQHGGDLGGWTRRSNDTLQLFDGRVTLRADVKDVSPLGKDTMVHAHVLTTLHEHEDEVLDACLMGVGNTREAALKQAAGVWLTCVAGPIKSFLDNAPVCMTCQAGVAGGDASKGYSPSDYGLPGLRAYVGPSLERAFDGSQPHAPIGDTKPWFRFAAESAAPRRVHLAKVTILSKGQDGWSRELEVDGHDVAHKDPDWPAGVRGPDKGYLTRFAVFEFPRNSTEIARRAELERTIRYFAANYGNHRSVDDLMNAMIADGFDADLVYEVESISTIAFSRTFFEHYGIQCSPNIIRARRDGRVEMDVPLMSISAYTRGRAIAAQLRQTMNKDAFQALCLYNAESNVIVQAMDAMGDKVDMTQMKLYPCVVPERGLSDQTLDAALAKLNELIEKERAASEQERAKKKPWWKFW